MRERTPGRGQGGGIAAVPTTPDTVVAGDPLRDTVISGPPELAAGDEAQATAVMDAPPLDMSYEVETTVPRASRPAVRREAPAELPWDSVKDSVKVTAVREISRELLSDAERRAIAWSDQTPSDLVPLPGPREISRQDERPPGGARRETPRPAARAPSGPLASAADARLSEADHQPGARSDQTPSGLSLVPPRRTARRLWKRRLVLTLVFLVCLAAGLAATLFLSALVG